MCLGDMDMLSIHNTVYLYSEFLSLVHMSGSTLYGKKLMLPKQSTNISSHLIPLALKLYNHVCIFIMWTSLYPQPFLAIIYTFFLVLASRYAFPTTVTYTSNSLSYTINMNILSTLKVTTPE